MHGAESVDYENIMRICEYLFESTNVSIMKKFVIILPNIRSGHNVGAMFRTADGAGVDKLYLTGYTPRPPHRQVDKVSLGAKMDAVGVC